MIHCQSQISNRDRQPDLCVHLRCGLQTRLVQLRRRLLRHRLLRRCCLLRRRLLRHRLLRRCLLHHHLLRRCLLRLGSDGSSPLFCPSASRNGMCDLRVS